MRKTYIIVSVLSIYLFLSVSTIYSQEPEVKIGVLSFQPFYILEEGQEPSGIFIDYLKAALNRCNLSYSIKGYPPKRLYKYLAEGEADIFLGVKGVPELEGNVLYSNEKITQIDLRVYSRQDIIPIINKEDFKGKRVLTIRGYSYGGFIKYLEDPVNKIVADMTNSHELAFKKLQAKRADYLLDYSAPSNKALKAVGITSIDSHSILLLDIVLIVSKKTPNAQNLLNKMEQAFKDLKEEGKIPNL